MNTTQFGSLGESKVITRLIELNFNVFIPAFDRNTDFDLIAHKDSVLWRIQVKSTSRVKNKAYAIGMRSCRSNTSKIKIKKFDSKSCDIVAIYIHELNKICFIPSEELSNVASAIQMRENYTKHANGRKQWIISNYEAFPLSTD